MKTNKKLHALLAGTAFFCGILTINASAVEGYSTPDIEAMVNEIGDNLEGGWAYTVEGAPEGYEKGFLVIVKENDVYKVQVQIGPSTLLGENVVVKGKNISFDVMVEGSKVSVALTANGSTISGKSSSTDGTYVINGVKSISAE